MKNLPFWSMDTTHVDSDLCHQHQAAASMGRGRQCSVHCFATSVPLKLLRALQKSQGPGHTPNNFCMIRTFGLDTGIRILSAMMIPAKFETLVK